MNQFRGVLLLAAGAFALYQGWKLHTGSHALWPTARACWRLPSVSGGSCASRPAAAVRPMKRLTSSAPARRNWRSSRKKTTMIPAVIRKVEWSGPRSQLARMRHRVAQKPPRAGKRRPPSPPATKCRRYGQKAAKKPPTPRATFRVAFPAVLPAARFAPRFGLGRRRSGCRLCAGRHALAGNPACHAQPSSQNPALWFEVSFRL